jgi:hypothetical protein
VNGRVGGRASEVGKAFRTSSVALRLAIEAWMRSIDDAHSDDGYAEANLRVLFGNQPVSVLFRRASRVRIETVQDLLHGIVDVPRLHGDAAKLGKVKAEFAACDTAFNTYDGIVEERRDTVAALKAAAAAFDLEYDNFAARLLKDEDLGRNVPKFVRGRGKVVDPELTVQPDPDKVEDPADPGAPEPTDAAPAPDAVEPSAPVADPDPVEDTPDPE